MSKNKIIEEIQGVLVHFLEESGYSLFNMEYTKEGKDWILRVYIDKEEGNIGLEDCEKVSVYLSEKLDDMDIIDRQYLLEVSSPGIDRPLIKDSDYEKYAGQDVDIFLYKAMDGRKLIHGTLKGLKDNTIVFLNEKGMEETINRDVVSQVKLAVHF